ncbi:MAG: AlkD-like family protein [Gemmatimonadetes bacterium]|nr:AlkD-like family protein [Gemmatimonadota bacterium]
MSTFAEVRAELQALANPADAEFLQRFFKTGPGEYGEGDRFLGIRVPALRRLVRAHGDLSVDDCGELLRTGAHEERLFALLALVQRYARADAAGKEAIHRLYLASTAQVNNWDLVDSSAESLVGAHLEGGEIDLLETLARSGMLWERRIAIVATFHFIKRGELGPTLRIAEMLLGDAHDLIHKAVGWMLREVGKRDQGAEEDFLRMHCGRMPRTMLRYAIEKFPDELRRRYLRGDA